MSKTPRFARLLPSVVVVGAGLLVLNGSGLVHDAYAGINMAAAADALTPPTAPGNKDFVSDDSQVASAAEVDVLTSLSKRRAELDARETDIQSKANILAATESRVDAKIAQLKGLQGQITVLLGQRDAAQEKQVAALIKTYSTMGKKAGPIFANLPDEVAVPVAQGMKSEDLATLMSAMPTDAAQKLTVKLANKLTLPQTLGSPAQAPGQATPAAAPAPPAPAAEAAAPAPKSGG